MANEVGEPRRVNLMGIGRLLKESGMFPDLKSQAQAAVKVMAGRELGLGPVYSMQKIHIVQGRIMVGSELLAAQVKKSQRYDYEIVKHNDRECVIWFYDNGRKVYRSSFTIDDAKRAKLGGASGPNSNFKEDSSWAKWPRNMLFSRAIAQGVHTVCPDVIAQSYSFEDLGIETDEQGRPMVTVEEGEFKQIPAESEERVTFTRSNGQPDWSKFWKRQRDRGVDHKRAHELLGVNSIKDDLVSKGTSLEEVDSMIAAKLEGEKTPEDVETESEGQMSLL